MTGQALGALGTAASAEAWRARLAASEQAGVTEIVYQRAGLMSRPRQLEVV